MSSAAAAPKTIWTRAIEALLLLLVFGVLFVATRAVPKVNGGVGAVAAVGFLLLAGTLLSELVEAIGLPHLSGYLAAGVLAGPYVAKLLDHEVVARLSPINTLALSLIALAGGAELKLDLVKKSLKSLVWATVIQSSLVLVVMTGVFVALRPLIPFAHTLSLTALVGAGLIWGTLSVSRSPAAVLGIMAQLRPRGPLADFTLAFVMTSDVVVVVMMAAVLAMVRPLIDPSATFSLTSFGALGHELLGSVALGTTLGLILAAYLRVVGKHLLLVLLVLGFGLSELLDYLRFDPLLTFLVAGFLVQNLTTQGEKLLHAVEQTGSVVYVVFFATAGAHLDIPLLRALWPVAVALAGARAVVSWAAARLASNVAGDPPVLKTWGWSSLVSQAGLTLGLTVVVAREFPAFGAPFRSLAIATVAINEIVGPIALKFALDRAGETGKGHEPIIDEPGLNEGAPVP
jgi:Kef-type K+ transport system membrane component KefB